MTTQTPAVEFMDVTKTYRAPSRAGGAIRALDAVSFRVDPGQVFALLGPNRAGKTTLLKIVLGLCGPSGGRATRLGKPLSDPGTLARVGYMHENQAFPSYLTAVEVLNYYGGFAGVSRAALRVRVPALLERLGLRDRPREPIARFSKGMVQRLAIAQSLIGGPDLLVLDEPMEGLDLSARLLLDEIVLEQRRAGKTVLLVSHALEQVARVADSVAVLVAGRLAYLGPIGSLVQDPDTDGERSLESALAPIYGS